MGQGPIIPKYKSLSIAVCFWYVLPLIHPSALCECLSSVGAASQVAAARVQCAVLAKWLPLQKAATDLAVAKLLDCSGQREGD